jgi:hypothetical protein
MIAIELDNSEARAILEIIDGASPSEFPVAVLGRIYAKILTAAEAQP